MASAKALAILCVLIIPLAKATDLFKFESSRVRKMEKSQNEAQEGFSYYLPRSEMLQLDVDEIDYQIYGHMLLEVHTEGNQVLLCDEDPAWISWESRGVKYGRDVGVNNRIEYYSSSKTWYIINNSTSGAECFFKLHMYRNLHPYSGRCPDYDPNLRITYKNGINYIRFDQPIVREHSDGVPLDCAHNVSKDDFRLELYQKGLPYSHYIDWWEFIWSWGTMVNVELNGHSEGEIRVATYPGNQVKYRLTLSQRQRYYGYSWFTSEYVSTIALSCPDSNECSTDPVEMAVGILLGSLGLIICFAAEKLPKLGLFVCGFCAFGLMSYISLMSFTRLEHMETIAVASACGVCFGFVWALLHRCKPQHAVFALLPGLCMAFLVACCVVNLCQPLANELWYRWMSYHFIYILVTVLCVTVPKAMRIFGTSVVGSYLLVCMVDIFIGGLIRQVAMVSINSAIYKDMSTAFIIMPWRPKDIILASCWAALTVSGVIVQCLSLVEWKNICCGCKCCRICRKDYPLSIRADDVIDDQVTFVGRSTGRDAHEEGEVHLPTDDRTPLLP